MSPPQVIQVDCGTVTFAGFSEKVDGTTFPLPWNSVYKQAWKTFLKALAAKFGSNKLLVSISVAGPTAASAEIIVHNDANSDNPQTALSAIPPQGCTSLSPSCMWNLLLSLHYFPDESYLGTDKAFIEEWEDAIDLYGELFPGITLVVTTGNGLPNFAGAPDTPPEQLQQDCMPNMNPDCAAEATILAYFMQKDVAGANARATQTSGMVASHQVANMNDMGVPAVKQLLSLTQDFIPPSEQILGGSQFNATYSIAMCNQLLDGSQQNAAAPASTSPDQPHSLWNCPVCGATMRVVEPLSAAQLLLRSPPQPDRCAA